MVINIFHVIVKVRYYAKQYYDNKFEHLFNANFDLQLGTEDIEQTKQDMSTLLIKERQAFWCFSILVLIVILCIKNMFSFESAQSEPN